MYFEAIGELGFSPLTPEEERELSKAALIPKRERAREKEDGERDTPKWRARIAARNKLVEHNLPLVPWVARRYLKRGLPFADLIQAGNVGLIRAAELFNWRTGNKFVTYAVFWIRQGILRALRECPAVIRIPVYMQERHSKISRAAERMRAAIGREPTPEEIGRNLDLTAENVRMVSRLIEGARTIPLGLGGARNDDGGRALPSRFAPATRELGPLERLEAKEELHSAYRALADMLTRLSSFPKHQQVMLRMRYGLDRSGKTKTLKDVARPFEVTRERVRQILKKMNARLKELGFGANRVEREIERIRALEDLTGTDAAELHALLPPPVDPPPRIRASPPAQELREKKRTNAVPLGWKQFEVATILWPTLSHTEARHVDFRELGWMMGQTAAQVCTMVYMLERKGVLVWERPACFRRGTHLVLVPAGTQGRLRLQNLNSFGPRTRARK